MLALVLLSVLLLQSTGASPHDTATGFQSRLNGLIFESNQAAIYDTLSSDFDYLECSGEHFDRNKFAQFLIAEGRQGVVTGARDDGQFIYYSVNYGGRDRNMVYLLKSDVSLGQPGHLAHAKHIDCKFVGY